MYDEVLKFISDKVNKDLLTITDWERVPPQNDVRPIAKLPHVKGMTNISRKDAAYFRDMLERQRTKPEKKFEFEFIPNSNMKKIVTILEKRYKYKKINDTAEMMALIIAKGIYAGWRVLDRAQYTNEDTIMENLLGSNGWKCLQQLNADRFIAEPPRVQDTTNVSREDAEKFLETYSLDALLRQQGLKEHDCGGGGDCQFKVWAYYLGKFYGEIRQNAMQHMEDNPALYSPDFHVDFDISAYIRKMSRSREWGDAHSLHAIALCYKRNFTLYETDDGVAIRKTTHMFDEDWGNPEDIRIGYKDGNHYVAVIRDAR